MSQDTQMDSNGKRIALARVVPSCINHVRPVGFTFGKSIYSCWGIQLSVWGEMRRTGSLVMSSLMYHPSANAYLYGSMCIYIRTLQIYGKRTMSCLQPSVTAFKFAMPHCMEDGLTMCTKFSADNRKMDFVFAMVVIQQKESFKGAIAISVD